MKTLSILALGLLSFSALAAPVVTSWTNPECATGNCEVKGMKIFVDNMSDRAFRGNNASIEIETSKPEFLSKYAIVQYIKGCHYETSTKGGVKMSRRSILGKQNQPFLHKDWEIDSADDVDPIFWSNDAAGYDDLRGFEVPRNSGYAYANPILTDNWGSWAGKIKNLKSNKIYMYDMPTPAKWAMNPDLSQAITVSSLKFKACIYEISKVPREATSAQVQYPDPINCMEWSSNFNYDVKTRKFVEQKEISEVCR